MLADEAGDLEAAIADHQASARARREREAHEDGVRLEDLMRDDDLVGI
jgi:hypothetical protein